jgi:hypothetical protein
MARNTQPKSGGPARIRLVVLDAEVADGDLGALTDAVQNALRPTTVVQRVLPRGSGGVKTLTHQHAEDEPDAIEEDEEELETEQPVRAPRQRSARKAPKEPDVVDIDMNTEVTLASFVSGKKIDSIQSKYMTVAAWLRDHRNLPTVTVDHIYTCFRFMNWSTNIQDFAQPLRDLKGKKFFTTPERGQYAINHLGLDYVKKLGESDATS